ncbi:MAG: CRISPR-associated protein Cas8a1/Csx13 [Desulfobulbaceae bacterium]|nr:CRISPR-associated protein Cas8a1/Csx13 [Desulfobulbaceae bacterium]
MKEYSTCFQRYLKIPLRKLSANSLGDAALACMVELKAKDDIKKLGVSGCTVISMGTAKWSDKQKTRTSVFTINRLYEEKLNLFDIAYRCLPNRVIIMEKSGKEEGDKYFVATSICRGLVANNIALGFEWFKDFHTIMRSKKIAIQVSYERRELSQMVKHTQWSFDDDRLLVESIHNAIRNRYGELANRASQRGADVHNLFEKEFERMRSSLMRAKNSQTLRVRKKIKCTFSGQFG